MPYQTRTTQYTRLLYDGSWLECPEALFLPENQRSSGESVSIERGTARFFEYAGRSLALKHYHRGGLIGRLIRDTYFALPGQCPRMLAEFRLLARLRELDLPVPEPVAARVQRTGRFTYRGDLITARITGSHTLYEHLCQKALSAGQWRSIGRTIARFHQAGLDHADLNATNILLDDQDRAWLIDFDKGRIRRPGAWKARNLRRLRRSLDKLSIRTPGMHCTDSDWHLLLEGYSR